MKRVKINAEHLAGLPEPLLNNPTVAIETIANTIRNLINLYQRQIAKDRRMDVGWSDRVLAAVIIEASSLVPGMSMGCLSNGHNIHAYGSYNIVEVFEFVGRTKNNPHWRLIYGCLPVAAYTPDIARLWVELLEKNNIIRFEMDHMLGVCAYAYDNTINPFAGGVLRSPMLPTASEDMIDVIVDGIKSGDVSYTTLYRLDIIKDVTMLHEILKRAIDGFGSYDASCLKIIPPFNGDPKTPHLHLYRGWLLTIDPNPDAIFVIDSIINDKERVSEFLKKLDAVKSK